MGLAPGTAVLSVQMPANANKTNSQGRYRYRPLTSG
jgi:hypothetical protein